MPSAPAPRQPCPWSTRRQRRPLAVLWLPALMAASGCAREGASDATPPAARLVVRTAERADARTVGADTLSDSARVLRVFPEADGDAVAFTFADPMRRVSSGLAITQRRAPTPALLWPDSVTQVWWSGPHAVAFNTGGGAAVHAVVDVHAERATVTDSATRPAAREARVAGNAPMERASAYIDSVRTQPGGRPVRSALVYRVRTIRMAPGGDLAAFYVTAADSGQRRAANADGTTGQVNPGWYALDVRSWAVAPIDEVVGPAAEMPESAGGWTADGRFVYAKRLTIWEAEVRKESSGAPGASDTASSTAATQAAPDSAVLDSTMPDSLAGP